MVQALQKELANFGKEKDKHIRNAQTKATKAKADTEVGLPPSSNLAVPCPQYKLLKHLLVSHMSERHYVALLHPKAGHRVVL